MPSKPLNSDGPSPSTPNARLQAWSQSVKWYLSPMSLRMVALGFSAGLPLLLVLGTLGFRLRESGIDRTTIGFLSWVGLVYAFKWLWSPLVDSLQLPWLTTRLGKRRAWLLFSQCLLVLGLMAMATLDPSAQLSALVGAALFVTLASATQDIALDAFRIESAPVEDQGALAAMYQTGYRLGMIWAGAGALWLAQRAQDQLSGHEAAQAWQISYLLMAASMGVGILATCLSRTPVPHQPAPHANLAAEPKSSWQSRCERLLIAPFKDFFSRFGWRALLILLLISTYRISDIVMGVMANPFYSDMGYTKDEIAMVSKVFGVVMTLCGAFLGGLLTKQWGVIRVLMWGAALSALSNLLFAWLSTMDHEVWALVGVICADNLSGGIASAAFIAFLSGLTRIEYSASQYALLSSLMIAAPQWLAGFSGLFVDHFGYTNFFIATALMGLPVLALVAWAAPMTQSRTAPH
jgi:MFS transporter, PAT family, beta-lactamase induction signal transducer AmpG